VSVGPRHRVRCGAGSLASLVLAGALLALPAHGDSVYVIDRLEIGVHQGTDLDSVILAVVPSGTELTVMDRDGEFVEVRTPDGVTGWVDGRYVVDEKPGSAVLGEREAEFAEATRALGAARAQVEVLRQQLVELQLSVDEQQKQQENTPTPTPDENNEKLSQALSDLQALADENQRMKGEISRLEAARTTAANELAMAREEMKKEVTVSAELPPVEQFATSAPWSPWQWLLFASILLLAFGAGGYLVDWEARRRHGGFRI
jgi:SH3 domain protein